MCLTIYDQDFLSTTNFKIATEDIEVYKKLIYDRNTKKYEAYHNYYFYKLHNTYNVDLEDIMLNSNIAFHKNRNIVQINNGLHSFVQCPTIYSIPPTYIEGKIVIIAKFIIPKNSYYIEGEGSDGYPNYVSTSLKFVEDLTQGFGAKRENWFRKILYKLWKKNK